MEKALWGGRSLCLSAPLTIMGKLRPSWEPSNRPLHRPLCRPASGRAQRGCVLRGLRAWLWLGAWPDRGSCPGSTAQSLLDVLRACFPIYAAGPGARSPVPPL